MPRLKPFTPRPGKKLLVQACLLLAMSGSASAQSTPIRLPPVPPPTPGETTAEAPNFQVALEAAEPSAVIPPSAQNFDLLFSDLETLERLRMWLDEKSIDGTASDVAPRPSPLRTKKVPYRTALPASVHEYGPPGHVRRRNGEGPSVPVFVPVQPRPAVADGIEGDDGSFVRKGTADNSYLVPGSSTSYRWGGFIHMDTMFDFNPIGATDDFVTATIPVPGERGQNSNFTPRYSRLDWETHTSGEVGDVKTYMQVDFFNGNTQLVFGSFPLRLRFAYLDFGWFRFGQDASAFMDYDVFPLVIDYEGPGSTILIRQAVARVTLPVSQRLKIALSAEQPFSDITIPVDVNGDPLGDRLQQMPDFVAHLRYDSTLGHFQLSGLARQLTYQPNIGATQSKLGYGVNLTGDFHPWAWLNGATPLPAEDPPGWAKSRVLGQYGAGYGIARYLEDPNGLGNDAALDSSGVLNALFTRGWYADYEHWWARQWCSNFAYGENFTALTDAQPDDSYAGAKYMATNLLWVPTARAWFGIEYLWGERENRDGQSARARRLQFAAQYNF